MNVFELFAKIFLDTSDYDSELDGASKKTSSFGEKLKSGLSTAAKVGAAAVGVATTAAAGFAAASVKTGMSFDSSMSQVAATMGYSVDELHDKSSEASKTFDTLRNFAMEMGSQTAFSATEAADALNYMALAGYDADKSMTMLPNVLNLAAAGGIDLASASDMVTDAQSALGLSMDETTELVDKMAMASSKSNTSVAQLGEAILTVGGTAKNLAGGTTELSTALGILADNGVKGAEGGTALRNIILSLGAPTDKAAKALDQMGVSVYDANGNMRPLNETFSDLEATLSTMTQGEQTEVLNTIFNKVDLKSVNALLANTGERFDELSGYIDKAKGSAENMAKTQLDNLAGDVTLFQSALEGAQIVISDKLTPSLREFVQFGSESVSRLSEAFQDNGLSGAMEALGEVLSEGISMILEKLPEMVDAGMQLLGALGKGLLENLPVITDAAIEIITMLVEGLAQALPQLAEGAAQIITQLASGIGEALPELIPTAVEAVLKFIEGLTSPGAIGGLLEGAAKLINGLIEGIVAAVPILIAYAPQIIANLVMALILEIPKLLEVGVNLIMGLGKGLIQGVLALPKFIAEVVTAIIDGFKSLFGIHSPSTIFAEMGTNLIEGLLQGISDTWNRIVEFFSGAVEALTAFFSGAWENIRSGAEAAWNAIGDVLKAAWEAVKSAWEGAVDFFSGLWEGIQNVFSAVSDFFGEVFSAAWEAIQTAWEGVTDFFSGVWEGIQEVFSTVVDVLGGFFSDSWETIQGVWEVAKDFFSDIAEGIHSVFEEVTEALSGFFEDAWEAVKAVWETAVDFFGEVWEGISGAFESAVEFFEDVFSRAWEGIQDAWSGVSEFFQEKWEAIQDVFGDVWEKFTDIGGNIVKGLKDGILGAWDSFSEWFGGKVDGVIGLAKDIFGVHSPSTVFSEIGGFLMQGLEQGIDENSADVDNVLLELCEAMPNIFSTTPDEFLQLGKKTISLLSNGLGMSKSEVSSVMMEISQVMTNSISNLPSIFSDIGSDAAYQLGSGLGEKISSLQEKVRGLMSDIANAAKSALGISTPSKAASQSTGAISNGLSLKQKTERGMTFSASSNISGTSAQKGKTDARGGDTYNFYSPKALDAVSAAREMKKAKKQISMGFV